MIMLVSAGAIRCSIRQHCIASRFLSAASSSVANLRNPRGPTCDGSMNAMARNANSRSCGGMRRSMKRRIHFRNGLLIVRPSSGTPDFFGRRDITIRRHRLVRQ